MPIHLIWGDDSASKERAVDNLINEVIDPAWGTMNLSRLDGGDPNQAKQALEEVITPPFGSGGRLVLLQQSPFCNGCTNELAEKFEEAMNLIPQTSHLVLTNDKKPDGRLKTTKKIKKLMEANQAIETTFLLPQVWDGEGLKQLVKRTAQDLSLNLEEGAITALSEAIGNDTLRLESELKKLAIHSKRNQTDSASLITSEDVDALVQGKTTNSLKISEFILEGNTGEAIAHFDALIKNGEPALRIIATLTGQIRGWLWVSLFEKEGERDVNVIAKAAGINNPKRIYVMRKQLRQRPPSLFLKMLSQLLEIEASLKRGSLPNDAFRDGLLIKQHDEWSHSLK